MVERSRARRPQLDAVGVERGMISLCLGLKGYAAEGADPGRVPAEMGQIDRRRRRRRRGYARRLPPRTFAPAYRLDKTFSIDGGRGSGCRQIELASWGGQI